MKNTSIVVNSADMNLYNSHIGRLRRPMLSLQAMNLFGTDISLYVNLHRAKVFGTDIFLYVNLYRAKVFGTDIFLYVNLYRAKVFGTDICLGQTSVWKKKLSSKTFLFLHLFGCKQFYLVLHDPRFPKTCLVSKSDHGKWVKKSDKHTYKHTELREF